MRDRTFPQPLVRFSELKHMARSPAHYRDAVQRERAPSAAMHFGTLCHSVILGGKGFVVYDGKRDSSNKWRDFKAEHAGSMIVTPDELRRALEVARRVHDHPIAGPLMIGKREQELAWAWNGRACGGRLDLIGDTWIADLKMSRWSEPGWFIRNATRLAYHAQMAWYFNGALSNGHTVKTVHLVAVEPVEPHAIQVFDMHPHALGKGEALCHLWLERVVACEAAGKWPEYTQSAVTFDIPDELEITYGDDAEESEAA